MAEYVVSSVVETVGDLLIDKAKFLCGIKGKVEDLQRELKLIRCFLRNADAKQEHDRAVGESVAQLRDIAYDAEDVIERYILRVAPKKERNIIKTYACFMAKCTCAQAHVVGTEIEGLKSRISDIGGRMQQYGIQSVQEGEREHAMPKRTYDHFKEDFVGREDSIKELVKELLNDGKRRGIFICGMGGLGKTSLAKKVVSEVTNNFDGLAWACVSQKFHVNDILVGILVKLIPDERDKVMKMMDHELFETLYSIQQEKKYIVVLDDIWTKEAWLSLQAAFPIKDVRSKLLITTRNRQVVEYIDPQGFFHEPRCLSDWESWDLLKKRAFPETKGLAVELSSVGLGVGQDVAVGQAVEGITGQSKMEGHIPVIDENMKRLGDELLKKCGGLPLAVNVLGGLLAVKEWETIYKKINLHFSDENDVSKVLALSFDDLPWHLKPCFLYLGSFPKGAEISATKVLHMWIAEGLVPLNAYDKERKITVEDVAEQYLMELVNRGMVHGRFDWSGKIKTCYLHDLMRDLCVSKAMQESFLSILNILQGNEIEHCSSSKEIEVESTCKTRRLSLNMCVSAKEDTFPRVEQIGGTMLHLRTLMLFGIVRGMWEQFQPIFINNKFLRVLKLECIYQMRGNLPESVGDLVHLRFLSLARSYFEGLPQSMENLVCMEFLDISGTRLNMVILPNMLWKMRRLRYLHLPYQFAIKEKSLGDRKKLWLGTLKNLRTLRNFSLKKCDVNDVGKLTNLQKLTVFDQYDPIELEIFPQLAEFNLKHLRSSSFYFGNSDCLWTKGQLSKMPNYGHLHKLSINGKIEKLPEHESLPQQLRKLVLLNSQLEEDPMPILEKLENLVFLMLEKAFNGEEMICSAGGFPQLKHLVISLFPRLEVWRVAEGAMPHLSRVRIHGCHNLKVVPSHVPTDYSWDEVETKLWHTVRPSARVGKGISVPREATWIERFQTICCLGYPLCIGLEVPRTRGQKGGKQLLWVVGGWAPKIISRCEN